MSSTRKLCGRSNVRCSIIRLRNAEFGIHSGCNFALRPVTSLTGRGQNEAGRLRRSAEYFEQVSEKSTVSVTGSNIGPRLDGPSLAPFVSESGRPPSISAALATPGHPGLRTRGGVCGCRRVGKGLI